MVPPVTFQTTVVAWVCVALVVTDAKTADPGFTTTNLAPGVGQHGLEVPSDNTENNTFEFGSECFEADDERGDLCNDSGQGSYDPTTWTSDGDAVDLGELADRVSDALGAAVDGDGDSLSSASSSPGSTSPVYSAQGTAAFSNQGEQECGDNVQQGGVAQPAQRDDAGHEIVLDAGMGGTCGEGEHQRICRQDEECCNTSCGICAPRGRSCLQISCGVLSRGGGSKVYR